MDPVSTDPVCMDPECPEPENPDTSVPEPDEVARGTGTPLSDPARCTAGADDVALTALVTIACGSSAAIPLPV